MKRKKTILVIEDEISLLGAIKIKMEKNNFSVIEARSVEQAKKKITDTDKVDAIWLDHYLLGKENGLDFVSWCKKGDAEFKKIPIFIVSNTATSDKIHEYMMFGITKYYIKSEKRLEEIIDEIKKQLT